MFFFGDPLYTVLTLVGLPLVFLPQLWVKSTYNRFRKVPNNRGLTGAQVAEEILRDQRIYDVAVEMTPGELSDHYDPGSKKIRLSEDNYHGRSVAALTIAAHEVGHAMQHATGYVPVIIRGFMAPAVNIGSQLGPILFFVSLGLGMGMHTMPEWAWLLAWFGVGLFGLSVLFHMVTLPVEIDASMRAVKVLAGSNYLIHEELPGAKKVLTAAAMTYVATALYSLIQLAYYIMRLTSSRRG